MKTVTAYTSAKALDLAQNGKYVTHEQGGKIVYGIKKIGNIAAANTAVDSFSGFLNTLKEMFRGEKQEGQTVKDPVSKNLKSALMKM